MIHQRKHIHFFINQLITHADLRIRQPLDYLADQLYQQEHIEFTTGSFAQGVEIPLADAYWFLNHVPASGVEIVRQLKQQGRIVWTIDDDYWHIADTNPVKKDFDSWQLSGLDHCLDLADLILTTTPHLAGVIDRPAKTLVVPNYVDLLRTPPLEQRPPRQNKTVLWQGSITHAGDLDLIGMLPAMMPDWRFIFMGQLPKACSKPVVSPAGHVAQWVPTLPNVGFVAGVDYRNYFDVLVELSGLASVGLCPLDTSDEFVKSKSNLKYLEMASMGLCPIVSPAIPYNMVVDGSNGLVANSPAEWKAKIESASPEMAQKAYCYVRDNWSWTANNAKETWLNAFKSAVCRQRVSIVWGS